MSSALPVGWSSVLSSSAHARLGASAMSAVELAHSVPTRIPVPCRNSRRRNTGRARAPSVTGCVDSSPPYEGIHTGQNCGSRVVAVTLQHFDLVAVGILHEK